MMPVVAIGSTWYACSLYLCTDDDNDDDHHDGDKDRDGSAVACGSNPLMVSSPQSPDQQLLRRPPQLCWLGLVEPASITAANALRMGPEISPEEVGINTTPAVWG
jgi:hypothetical protein